jgi:hypothetical protein
MKLTNFEKTMLSAFILATKEEQAKILHDAKTVNWHVTSAALEKGYQVIFDTFD